jgi:hypothetical protein
MSLEPGEVLTYMSIPELINANLGTRLHLWAPVRPGRHSRVIYVEDRLFQDITAPTDFRIGVLWTDLDRFSLGGRITVGYGPEPTCMMKCLDPRADEIWEIRSKDPDPQVRVFGRFCGPDEFLATHATYRDHLGDPRKTKFEGNHWPAEIQRCNQIWDQICHGEPPYSGNTINDYITTNVVEVGKLP